MPDIYWCSVPGEVVLSTNPVPTASLDSSYDEETDFWRRIHPFILTRTRSQNTVRGGFGINMAEGSWSDKFKSLQRTS